MSSTRFWNNLHQVHSKSKYLKAKLLIVFKEKSEDRVMRIRKSEGLTTQNKNDKQRSTNHTHKTKYRETRTLLYTEGKLRCSGRIASSCSTSDNRRVNLVTKPGNKSWIRKGPGSISISGTYPWSFVIQIFHNGQPSHGDDRKTSDVMTST